VGCCEHCRTMKTIDEPRNAVALLRRECTEEKNREIDKSLTTIGCGCNLLFKLQNSNN
jgi:hypothetical protein